MSAHEVSSNLSRPVVVVGAGPVGLTAAIELARRGVPVLVVDAGSGPSTTSKAIGIHARTLEALQRCGVSDRLVELGLPLRSFRFHDARRAIAELRFAEVPSAFPFALSLGQDETERVLLDRLRETGTEVRWGTRLVQVEQSAAGARLVVERDGDRHEVLASWVVGCDGARSTVRQQAGIAFEGEPFPEWFLVADLRIDSPVTEGEETRGRTNLFFSDEGATAVFPLPEPGLHRLATALPRTLVPDDRAAAPLVDLAVLQDLWARRIGRPARLSDPRWISPFQFNSRVAARYRSGRVFLAGDAAHVHSPVGGQGMNTGIQDAVNLSWKLAAVLAGAPEQLLDSYEVERRPVAAEVLHDSRRNAVMAAATSPLVRAGRALLLRTVTRVGPVRRRFLAGMTMLAVSYPSTVLPGQPASRRPGTRRGPGPGDRAPDGDVAVGGNVTVGGDEAVGGDTVGLLALLATHGHVLLSFDTGSADQDEKLAELVDTFRTGPDPVTDIYVLPVRRRPRGSDGRDLPSAWHSEVSDPTGRVHETYGASRPVAFLIRPDGVIGWRGPISASSRHSLQAVVQASLPTATSAPGTGAQPRRPA